MEASDYPTAVVVVVVVVADAVFVDVAPVVSPMASSMMSAPRSSKVTKGDSASRPLPTAAGSPRLDRLTVYPHRLSYKSGVSSRGDDVDTSRRRLSTAAADNYGKKNHLQSTPSWLRFYGQPELGYTA